MINRKPPQYTGHDIMMLIIALAVLVVFSCMAVFHAQAQSCESPIDLGEQGTWSHCFDAPLDESDAWQPDCPTYYQGGAFWITFNIPESIPDSVAYTIAVFSDIAYDFVGDSIVWAHALIADSCEGSTLWSSTLCGLGADGTSGSFPGTDWFIDLYWQPGTYWMQIPIGIAGSTAEELQGCMTIYAGQFSTLGHSTSSDRSIISTPDGLVILVDGQRYDFTGRRIK